ncbi:hypothetical protein [Denitrobaculum tricleocarpae]|uniref:Uncharacterized protein n=1 Tax=Denitrobaculum tricleocarpae TaxID=2591009 RepID=A0A545U160_9PROT|nr:hypothetical protein [Denitrobaculum tricleocarpae]TQV83174.1 hypothetical protein FKG95_00800 [Denitrobaculum tricleocarpae]
MPPKKNPLKLNKLQLRTLALAQVLARDPGMAQRDEATGEAALLQLPHAHGNHLHVGDFTISTRDASGLTNPAVWSALTRKGLTHNNNPMAVATLTADGLAYDTGLGHRFMTPSDH